MIYAVIDTNVIISALLNRNSNPGKVVVAALSGKIIPVLHNEIFMEYKEVCSRKKFHFPEDIVTRLLNRMITRAHFLDRTDSEEIVPDAKDVVFYEVTLTAKDVFDEAYLITGNGKHFPIKPFVVTPAEMVKILEDEERK